MLKVEHLTKKGWKILDSCSAPGGKTTQLSAAAGEEGVVVANEYDAKRSRILQGNVERMGDRNTVVLNLDTAVLAETYKEVFDLVLADAPCSGEGMFRKEPQAIDEWSVAHTLSCSVRQKNILDDAYKIASQLLPSSISPSPSIQKSLDLMPLLRFA